MRCVSDALRLLSLASKIVRRHWQFIVYYLIVVIWLNWIPEVSFGWVTRGWPCEYEFGNRVHLGNAAYDIAFCVVLGLSGVSWLELRWTRCTRWFQFCLIDLVFGTAALAAVLACCADVRREFHYRKQVASLLATNHGFDGDNFALSSQKWPKEPISGRVVGWRVGGMGESSLPRENIKQALGFITEFRHLQRFETHHIDLSPDLTKRLRYLPNLFQLDIEINDPPSGHVENLAKIPNLSILRLRSKLLSDGDLAPLTSARNLRSLAVSGGECFRANDLEHLKNLTELRIRNCVWNPRSMEQTAQPDYHFLRQH